MKLHVTTALVAAGLLLTLALRAEAARTSNQPIRSNPFVEKATDRSFMVDGTIVSARGGSLVVRIDDHGHHIPFSLGSGVSASRLEPGSRVSVRYHPSGATGQIADDVQVLAGPRGARAR